MLGVNGCASKAFSTYNMATTSFQYDPRYTSYMLKLNNVEIGGGFGQAISTDPIQAGLQEITWKDSKTGQLHTAANKVEISRSQLKGKRYLAAHVYPDDTVEIITSDHWPQPTDKGMKWLEKLRKDKKN